MTQEEINAERERVQVVVDNLTDDQFGRLHQCVQKRLEKYMQAAGGNGTWQEMVNKSNIVQAVKYIRDAEHIGLYAAITKVRAYQWIHYQHSKHKD